MALWGGAIDVAALAKNENITPLYYLNNFNSYTEGLVTMFNVLVVNDWHAVAEVFLYANRCSSPYFVYPFFFCGICFGVFIMLNVITAFFVECKCFDLSRRSVCSSKASNCFVCFQKHSLRNWAMIRTMRVERAFDRKMHWMSLVFAQERTRT